MGPFMNQWLWPGEWDVMRGLNSVRCSDYENRCGAQPEAQELKVAEDVICWKNKTEQNRKLSLVEGDWSLKKVVLMNLVAGQE